MAKFFFARTCQIFQSLKLYKWGHTCTLWLTYLRDSRFKRLKGEWLENCTSAEQYEQSFQNTRLDSKFKRQSTFEVEHTKLGYEQSAKTT